MTKRKQREPGFVKWRCRACGDTYTNPIPVAEVKHKCRGGKLAPATTRKMDPVVPEKVSNQFGGEG